jgi:hypothetical protein
MKAELTKKCGRFGDWLPTKQRLKEQIDEEEIMSAT